MNPFRLVKAYIVKRKFIRAVWSGLNPGGIAFDGNTKYMNISKHYVPYEGPHVALAVIKNEKALKEHYRATKPPSLLIF